MELGYVHVLVLFTCISYLYDEHFPINVKTTILASFLFEAHVVNFRGLNNYDVYFRAH